MAQWRITSSTVERRHSFRSCCRYMQVADYMNDAETIAACGHSLSAPLLQPGHAHAATALHVLRSVPEHLSVELLAATGGPLHAMVSAAPTRAGTALLCAAAASLAAVGSKRAHADDGTAASWPQRKATISAGTECSPAAIQPGELHIGELSMVPALQAALPALHALRHLSLHLPIAVTGAAMRDMTSLRALTELELVPTDGGTNADSGAAHAPCAWQLMRHAQVAASGSALPASAWLQGLSAPGLWWGQPVGHALQPHPADVCRALARLTNLQALTISEHFVPVHHPDAPVPAVREPLFGDALVAMPHLTRLVVALAAHTNSQAHGPASHSILELPWLPQLRHLEYVPTRGKRGQVDCVGVGNCPALTHLALGAKQCCTTDVAATECCVFALPTAAFASLQSLDVGLHADFQSVHHLWSCICSLTGLHTLRLPAIKDSRFAKRHDLQHCPAHLPLRAARARSR